LLPEPAEEKKLPLIRKSPINLERVVKGRTLLGSPCPFLGEAILVLVDQEILNEAEELPSSKPLPSSTTPVNTGASTIRSVSKGSRKNKYVKAH